MENKQDIQLSYVNALKALDFEKEYETALKDLAEAIFDMDFQNNDVELKNNAD